MKKISILICSLLLIVLNVSSQVYTEKKYNLKSNKKTEKKVVSKLKPFDLPNFFTLDYNSFKDKIVSKTTRTLDTLHKTFYYKTSYTVKILSTQNVKMSSIANAGKIYFTGTVDLVYSDNNVFMVNITFTKEASNDIEKTLTQTYGNPVTVESDNKKASSKIWEDEKTGLCFVLADGKDNKVMITILDTDKDLASN